MAFRKKCIKQRAIGPRFNFLPHFIYFSLRPSEYEILQIQSFFSPTSTKPVGLKIIKLDIVLMVELAVLLVWKEFKNDAAFPRWIAMDIRWNRWFVSLRTLMIDVIRLRNLLHNVDGFVVPSSRYFNCYRNKSVCCYHWYALLLLLLLLLIIIISIKLKSDLEWLTFGVIPIDEGASESNLIETLY